MLKLKTLLVIFLAFLVLYGCTNQKEQTIELTGQSNSWLGRMIITKVGERYKKETIIKPKQTLKISQLDYSSVTNNSELGESTHHITNKSELQSNAYGENSVSGGDIHTDWTSIVQNTTSGQITIEWIEEGGNHNPKVEVVTLQRSE
ncbi:hypothetical protein [Brevibacillus sp. H7]|uniref:hypothetical protein n=1 Tax=Brevibacillus sp. H7 TaxID=3349138 RepID=UPI003811E2B0